MSGQEAFERALEALSRKERTEGELTEWLSARGFDAEDVEATVARLIELGELEDARFARRYAEDKRELRGWGADRIREALAAKGLDRTTIDAAIGNSSAGDELARALALLERRGEPALDEASRARALGFLARRGYDSALAYEAVRAFERRAA
jgi:regulatory protein